MKFERNNYTSRNANWKELNPTMISTYEQFDYFFTGLLSCISACTKPSRVQPCIKTIWIEAMSSNLLKRSFHDSGTWNLVCVGVIDSNQMLTLRDCTRSRFLVLPIHFFFVFYGTMKGHYRRRVYNVKDKNNDLKWLFKWFLLAMMTLSASTDP